MQILGKRSKILLIVVAITMLIALGVSFAMWDTSAVKATNGDLSTYANAKVGDIIEFGRYYQTGNRINNDENAEYEKTPIEWIVVDKDERTGQLTLMSKYILACGSYFGNYYDDGTGYGWKYNNKSTLEVGGIPYNQAYVDSTVRAFLNNLERLDMGGDTFDATLGYIPSGIDSTKETGLLSNLGFSNKRYWTKLNTSNAPNLDGIPGFAKRPNLVTPSTGIPHYEYYYQRPIKEVEFVNRPVTRGFIDEAFNNEQKSMLVPKVIAGYTGNRWPDDRYNVATKSYIEGAFDKVWLPSATELNIMNGEDWNQEINDAWTNPSDETGSTVFEYFKNYGRYKNPYEDKPNGNIREALIAKRTTMAKNGKVGNYSIPVYDKGTTTAKVDILESANTTDYYWTRTPSSYWYYDARVVNSSGRFGRITTDFAYVGVRPCVILKY